MLYSKSRQLLNLSAKQQGAQGSPLSHHIQKKALLGNVGNQRSLSVGFNVPKWLEKLDGRRWCRQIE